MSGSEMDSDGIQETDVDLDEGTLRQIRERVLQAEKEKLNLALPRGINNEIEEIIEEEVR